MSNKFWMIWVQGTEWAKVRHDLEANARAEAERLTKQTGKPTYLLESVAVCSPTEPPVKWEDV